MKLYNYPSPSGARVSIFAAEKGLKLDEAFVDLMAGETREDAFLRINPLGEIPALVLDDGETLTESLAICRYLDGLEPNPPLFGKDARSRAFIEMWSRRMEQRMFGAIGDVARHEFEFFKARGQAPAYAKMRRRDFEEAARWLDGDLADGRAYIAGDAFSVADITGAAMLIVMKHGQYAFPEGCERLAGWAERVRERPSCAPFFS